MGAENPREIAVQVLRRQGSHGFIEDKLEFELARKTLSGPDRALCQELVFGLVRWQRTLDWLIARKTEGRTQNPALQILLRLGLYQLFWLNRIPDHAAVHETVELGKRFGFGAKAGFLNALLRGYIRNREQTAKELAALQKTEPALGYSHPDWLVARWQARWGSSKTGQLLQWNNTPPPTFARLNTIKTDATSLTAQWTKEGVEFHPRYFSWAGENILFELAAHPPFLTLESFRQGHFYIQDPSTLLAVHALDPQPGENILDLCAAPGGKAAYIAQRMANRGKIAALEQDASRLKMLQENCARLGATCIEPGLSGHGQESPKGALFDRVLLDAPCSNTGVLRRRIELRWRVTLHELDRLRQTQHSLLRAASDKVRPGGLIVYSTCSLESEENEGVVAEFLRERSAFKLISEKQLLPFHDGTDGAYVAGLRRV